MKISKALQSRIDLMQAMAEQEKATANHYREAGEEYFSYGLEERVIAIKRCIDILTNENDFASWGHVLHFKQ